MEKKILIALGSLVVLSMTFLSVIWLTQDSTEAEQEVNQSTLIEVDESKKGQSLDGLGERQSESTESNKEYIINPRTYEVLPSDGEETEDKEILLTFDDAPAGYALDIANLLFEQDVPAIFFVNGHFLKSEEQEAVLKEIYDMGFEIANHTYNHPVLPRLSTENQRKEIVDLNKRIEEIIGEKPSFLERHMVKIHLMLLN